MHSTTSSYICIYLVCLFVIEYAGRNNFLLILYVLGQDQIRACWRMLQLVPFDFVCYLSCLNG